MLILFYSQTLIKYQMKESTIERIKRNREIFNYPYYLSKKYKDLIISITECDEGLKSALINKQPYSLALNVDDIGKFIPRDEIRPSRYVGLIEYMDILGIKLTIIPSKRKIRRMSGVTNLITLDKEESNE